METMPSVPAKPFAVAIANCCFAAFYCRKFLFLDLSNLFDSTARYFHSNPSGNLLVNYLLTACVGICKRSMNA